MGRVRLNLTTGVGASNVIQSGNTFTFSFTNPVPLGQQAECALESITYSVSYYNISSGSGSTPGNNLIGYKTSSGAATKMVTIPNGNYNVSDINSYLQAQMTLNGDTAANIVFAVSFNTLSLNVTLLGGYQLDLTQGSLWAGLGYNSPTLVTTTSSSPTIVNISNITNIQVHLPGLVSGSYVNSLSSDVIYAFAPSAGPGQQATNAPFQPFYQPMLRSGQLQSLTMTFTDQAGNYINFNNQTITVNLLIQTVGVSV